MFAYCGNNPINSADSSGLSFKDINIFSQKNIVYEGTETGASAYRTYYHSMDQAAHAAGFKAALKTQSTNLEYAYGIFHNENGYYISLPVQGEHDYVDTSSLINAGSCAIVHSHPYCTGHDGNNFSKNMMGHLYGDALVAYKNKIVMYLAAPNGTLKKMTVTDWFIVNYINITEATIANDLPKDDTLYDCIGLEGE